MIFGDIVAVEPGEAALLGTFTNVVWGAVSPRGGRGRSRVAVPRRADFF
jgi:hypothetical protein